MAKFFRIFVALLVVLAVSPSAKADFLFYATTYNETGDAPLPGIVKVSSTGVVTPWDVRDSGGTLIAFDDPEGITLDSQGNVYVNDSGVTYRITPAGVASIFATAADPSYSYGVTVDASDNVYVQSSMGVNYGVYSYQPDGTPISNFQIAGGTAFISIESDGYLYASSSSLLRYTTAGVFDEDFAIDIPGLSGFVFDPEGNIYAGGVVDDGSWDAAIYKVSFDEGGLADVQLFSALPGEYVLRGMSIDSEGNIYTVAQSCECEGRLNLILLTNQLGETSTFATGEGDLRFNDLAMVPEPTTILLTACGMMALLFRRSPRMRATV